MASRRAPWNSRSYEPFRSWGETQIARMLNRYGVPYLYEHPVAVLDNGKTRIWYPDFQLCGQGILIEYCGRCDDPDYAEGIARKKSVYAENDLTALMFTPDLFRGDWPETVIGEIQSVHKQRLAFLQSRGRRRNQAGCNAPKAERASRGKSICGVYASGADLMR
jgi:hypothetical protein